MMCRRMDRDDQPTYTAGSFDDLDVKLGSVPRKNGYVKVTYGVEAA